MTRWTTCRPSSELAELPVQARAREGAFSALESRIGHSFGDPGLLTEALSHRSWCSENAGSPSNERLEFLGDAVIGLVVTDYLFRNRPDLPEGEMTKIRALVVSATTLSSIAGELGVGEAVLLGRGEELSGGREKPSILCDAMEAIIGAVYLDGGYSAACAVSEAMLAGSLERALAGVPGMNDHKTRLQEMAAAEGMGSPVYELDEDGPDHDKRFSASVSVDGLFLGRGTGRSKKQAEQAAAAMAMKELTIRRRPSVSGAARA